MKQPTTVKSLTKATWYKIGAVSFAAAAVVVVPVAVTQSVSRSSFVAQVQRPAVMLEGPDRQLSYGQPPSAAEAPAPTVGYSPGIIDSSLTTYFPGAAVGSAGLKIAYRFQTVDGERETVVLCPVQVVRGPDVVIDNTLGDSSPYFVGYAALQADLPAPGKRNGYGMASVDSALSTYRTDSAPGGSYKLAYRLKADNPNAPDLVLVYGVSVQQLAQIDRVGTEISVTYGTAVGSLPAPATIEGYEPPVLVTDQTTYKSDVPVGVSSVVV